MVKPESGAPFFLIYHLSSNHISSEGEIDLGNLRYEPATGDNLVETKSDAGKRNGQMY